MKRFFSKTFLRETVLYCVFGGFTTVINYVSFWAALHLFGEGSHLVANAISFFCASIFAYTTNKLFVFQSKSFAFHTLRKELIAFFGVRILSFLFEEFGLLLWVDVLKAAGFTLFGLSGVMIVKIVLSILVVAANYLLSKFLVFKSDALKGIDAK